MNTTLPTGCGRCQHRYPDGSACNAALDAAGHHARSCSVGGWLVRRHDACCAALAEWAEEMDCTVHREVVLPNASPNSPEARMDLVVRAPGSGVPIYVDVTIVSALARESLSSGAARVDGIAATIAARKKRAKYPNVDVTPFAIEEHGRLGNDALALVRRLAPSAPDERSRALRQLYQSLGSIVQRHSADSLLAATAQPSRTERPGASLTIPAGSAAAAVALPAPTDIRSGRP